MCWEALSALMSFPMAQQELKYSHISLGNSFSVASQDVVDRYQCIIETVGI
jgi:hypothetical protein